MHFFDIWTSKSGPNVWCFWPFDLKVCFAPQRRAVFRYLKFQKWSENGVFFFTFYILSWKCASRHKRVHFFDISTSKSGLRMVCVFVHFECWRCFAPQRRELFRHLNFQKWSEHVVLLTFWLENVLRATTAWFFSTFFLPFRAPASSSHSFSSLIFSLLFFSSDSCPPLLFHLSILSKVWLLNFLRIAGGS